MSWFSRDGSIPTESARDDALASVDTNSGTGLQQQHAAAAALKPGRGLNLDSSGANDQSTSNNGNGLGIGGSAPAPPALKPAPPLKKSSAPPPLKPAPPSRERNTPSKPKAYGGGGNVEMQNQQLQAGKTQSKVKFQSSSQANVQIFESFTKEELPNAIYSVEEESSFRAREESGNPPTPHSASPTDSMSRIMWEAAKAGNAKAEANKPKQESALKIPMEKGADTPTKNAALFAANHNWSKSYSHKAPPKKSDFDPSEYGILTVQQYEELDAETAVGDKEFLVADRFKVQLNNAYVEHVATTGSRAKSGHAGCFRSTLRDKFHINNVSAFIQASMWDEWLLEGEELDRRVAAHKQQQIAAEAKPPAVELRETLAPRVLYNAPPTPQQQPPAVIPPPTPIDLLIEHHKKVRTWRFCSEVVPCLSSRSSLTLLLPLLQESERRLKIDERAADTAEKVRTWRFCSGSLSILSILSDDASSSSTAGVQRAPENGQRGTYLEVLQWFLVYPLDPL